MTNRQLAKMYHEQGYNSRQISEMLGITRQRVHQILGKQDGVRFKVIGDTCPYKNLRAWMNKNKVSRAEFIRRMGYANDGPTAQSFSAVLRGDKQPKKDYIDLMLRVTGMTYEEMFAEG